MFASTARRVNAFADHEKGHALGQFTPSRRRAIDVQPLTGRHFAASVTLRGEHLDPQYRC